MSERVETSVFLESRSYRRRRLLDALRVLPVIGAWAFLIPLLWPSGPDGPPLSAALLYIFAAWAVMALLCAVLVRVLNTLPVPKTESAPESEA